MKEIFTITCLFLLVQFSVMAQGGPPCWPPAPVDLYSQAQVDSFPITFDPLDEGWCIVTLLINGEDITNVDSLYSITKVYGDVIIGTAEGSNTPVNSMLTDISGLSNLTTVDGKLSLIDNPILADLTGLAQINYDELSSIEIIGNPLLSDCQIESVCGSLSLNNSDVIIENNAPGCNSQEEVEEACGIVGINDLEQYFEISFYPNPFRDIITVEINENLKAESVSYNVINAVGEVVIQSTELKNNHQEINTGILPSGVYFIKLHSNTKSASYKLVKL